MKAVRISQKHDNTSQTALCALDQTGALAHAIECRTAPATLSTPQHLEAPIMQLSVCAKAC